MSKWFEPVAKAPRASELTRDDEHGEHDEDAIVGIGLRRHIHNPDDGFGSDLQRRIEALVSPILPPPPSSSSSMLLFDESPFPHPSHPHRPERQRERPPASLANDPVANFFYPRHRPEPSKKRSDGLFSPMNQPTAAAAASRRNSEEFSRCVSSGKRNRRSSFQPDHSARSLPGLLFNEEGAERDIQHEQPKKYHRNAAAGVASMECHLDERQLHQVSALRQTSPTNDGASDYGTAYGGFQHPHHQQQQPRPTKQMTLAQNPDTGDVCLTPPANRFASAINNKSWNEVGGRIQTLHPPNSPQQQQQQQQQQSPQQQKVKRQRKTNKNNSINEPEQALLPSFIGMDSAHPEQTQKITQGERKAQKKKENKSRSRKVRDAPRTFAANLSLTEASLEGLDQHVLNAGGCEEALLTFLEAARSQKYIAWTLIFFDGHFSTPFLPSCVKYCTEKGPKCKMWNCTCDRQIRAVQASAPILGAMFVFPSSLIDDNDNEDATNKAEPGATPKPQCFILPLGPTMTSDGEPDAIDPGFERMGHWPISPFSCDTSIRRRWDAFRSLLMDKYLKCVTYNATVALMPYHFHRLNDVFWDRSPAENGEERTGSLGQMDFIIRSVWDLRLVMWMLQPHSPEQSLEFDKACEGFPHLRPEKPQNPTNPSSPLGRLLEAKENLEFLYALFPILDDVVAQKGLRTSLDEIEGPLQSVLSAMECVGVGFHADKLSNTQQEVEKRISELTAEARFIAKDSNFLPSSSQQVSHLLFNVMRITVPAGVASSKTAKGSNHKSTSEEVLTSIQAMAKSNGVPPYRIVDIILEFRHLSKMLTTYIRPLPHFALEAPTLAGMANRRRKKRSKNSPEEETAVLRRIHPMWMQTAVRTGRLSCRKPNLQQVPSEGVLNMKPRDAFMASSSRRCLFACDYSQKEIRILAHMSKDPVLISLFNRRDGGDIYKQMSSAITGKPVEDISDSDRAISKQVTIAIIYGMGTARVAKKLGVDKKTAEMYWNMFFRRFQVVKRWIDATKEFARRTQFVMTIAGRRRYLDEIQSSDRNKKAQAERQAVNTIIQGSAADLMKLAMLKTASRLMDWKKERNTPGDAPTLLLQIHDELLFEVENTEENLERLKSTVIQCCADECCREFEINVPLELKFSFGSSWGSMKEL